MANTYYSKQGDTIDGICNAYYKRQADAVEAVLKANNHLADLGVELPVSTKILLPDLVFQTENKRVALW